MNYFDEYFNYFVATPFASFSIKGLTKAQVPYNDVKSPASIVPLKSFGCLTLSTNPPIVTNVVPVIIPNVIKTSAKVNADLEFFIFSPLNIKQSYYIINYMINNIIQVFNKIKYKN